MADQIRDQAWDLISLSTNLSKLGETQKAFSLLEDFLTEAISANRLDCIELVGNAAIVMADAIGDLQRLRQYHEQILTYFPNDAQTLYGFANVLSRQGHLDQAREYAIKCYKLSTARGSEIDSGLLELIAKQWPELDLP